MRPSQQEGSAWCCPVLGFLCCRRDPMGAGLSQTQDGAVVASQHVAQPITMAEVVRERKRKMNGGLATLRRRLLAGRRGARGPRHSDRAAPLRDLLREWSPSEVAALLEEYEALAALRDLCVQAELARPPAAALRGDLASLYDNRICPDTELIFKGSSFPVHRAILSARCPYFRDLLNNYPNTTSRISLEVSQFPQQVDTVVLDLLLRYLYAGEPAPQTHCSDVENCEISGRRRHNNAPPDCCPSQGGIHGSSQHHQMGGRLALDIVEAGGGGGNCVEPGQLRRLAQDLGAQPAALHRDMKHLLDSGEHADATLVFTWEPSPQPSQSNQSGGNNNNGGASGTPSPDAPPPQHQHHSQQHQVQRAAQKEEAHAWDYGFRPRMEMACHRAVLSARSPFFRNVIQRRFRLKPADPHSTVKIVLDERVIPHKYARVLLHAVYTDQVDLTLVMRGSTSIFGCSILGSHTTSLGEAQALAGSQQNNGGAGQTPRSGSSGNSNGHTPSPLEEAMELYEIGRFLELDILSQGCEDIIAERLSATSLAAVLKWSSQPHGSRWVHRQALRFLREEFLTVAAGPALPQLETCHLIHALRCPFLQASELDALRAVLRWGEHSLVKRMEDREPNLLSHTAHSVARKGVKKRDLSDSELRELLADILPLVRIDHILPPNSELLNQAIRRGLVSSPPSCMLGDDGAPASRADAWIRGKGHGGLYIRPRLYMPYYEEVKALLEDQMVQETELVRMRRARYIPDIPDTLYMVSAEPRARSSASVVGAAAESPRGGAPPRGSSPGVGGGAGGRGSASAGGCGGGAGGTSRAPAHPPPSPPLLRAMLARERELRRAPACMRATGLPLSHTHEITRQIRLRVVREFNLPDSVADTLEGAVLGDRDSQGDREASTPQDNNRSIQDGDDTDLELDEIGSRRCPQGGRDGIEPWCSESPVGNGRHPGMLFAGEDRPPSLESVSASRSRRRQAHGGRGLSEAMPDVAMATSSLNRLRIGHAGAPPPPSVSVVATGRTFEPPEPFGEGGGGDRVAGHSSGYGYTMDRANTCGYTRDEINQQQKSRNPDRVSTSSSYGDRLYPGVSYKEQYQMRYKEESMQQLGRYKGEAARVCHDDATRYSLTRSIDGAVVPFMNPNQHLLQDACGFSAYGRTTGRENRRRHNQWNGTMNKVDVPPAFQHPGEMDGAPPLQLDLGDGNQHTSPARHTDATQMSWSRSQQPQHDRSRNSSTLPMDYGGGHSQVRSACPPSPSGRQACGSYSRYLSGGVVQPPTSATAPVPLPPSTFNQNKGFSTLQHRSKSPRAVPGHATLQRPRPICPLLLGGAQNPPADNTCSLSSYQCGGQPGGQGQVCGSVCNLSGSVCGGGGGSTAGTPVSEKEPGVQRSHSAGSVTSIGAEIEKRDVKSSVQNVSGFNHHQSTHQPTEQPNPINSSPRHFRSISTLPEALSWDGLSRHPKSQYPPDWMSQQDSTAPVPAQRNSYGTYRGVSPFQTELLYSRGESPFSCIQQNQARPGSCGLVDVIQSSYQNNSRGDSPLYSAASRGNSPFHTLEGTPPTSQFSRTNSPYSSGHRMEFGARNDRLIDTYCQRAPSPGCRAYPTSRNSPSNLKIQQAASSGLQKQARNSPVPSFSNSSLKLQRSATDMAPSMLNYSQKQTGQRVCSSPNYGQKTMQTLSCGSDLETLYSQAVNLKAQQARVSNSPSMSSVASKQDSCHSSDRQSQGSGQMSQGTGHLSQGTGHMSQGTGHLSQGTGHKSQSSGDGDHPSSHSTGHSSSGSRSQTRDERYMMSKMTNPQYQMSTNGGTPRYL